MGEGERGRERVKVHVAPKFEPPTLGCQSSMDHTRQILAYLKQKDRRKEV